MKRSLLIATTVTLSALAAPAAACDPVPGALIFGGIGAAIANAPGAAVGAVLGSIITGSAPCYGYRGDRYYEPRQAGRYYERDYVERDYYAPAPAYYAPAPRAYYAPPVYYAAPSYRSYRSYRDYEPKRYYQARNDRPQYRHGERDYRDYRDRRDWR
jgi:hypothetical protein